VESGSGGQKGGTYGGRLFGGRSCEDSSAALLKELVSRLQDHSDSLQREIRRLQRALAEINGAIALSLDRVERLRSNVERLQAVFGITGGRQVGDEKPYEEQRSGLERRSSAERRRARSDVTGLLRWIEGTSLDRRKVPDRRNVGDRRKTVQGSVQSEPIVVPRAPRRRPGEVISLADYRRSRKAVSRPQL
jgi:hypothetical protein